MKHKLLLINLLVSQILFCQNSGFINTEYNFIGYNDKIPLYQYTQLETNTFNNYTIFKATLNKNHIVELEKFIDMDIIIKYYNSSFQVTFKFEDNKYLVDIIKNGRIYTSYYYNSIGYENKDLNIVYSKSEDLLIVPFIQKQGSGTDQISFLNINNLGDITLLPLYGNHFFIDTKGEYLYFSSKMICDNFSTMPLNVYRVKIGNWNNPELILEEVNDWFLISEYDIIYARIYLEKNERNKRILYNIKTQSYAKINNMHCQRTVKYNGQYYYEYKEKNQPIKYLSIDIPENFTFKDERIICGKNSENIICNLPNSQKTFPNTFITEYLLYDTDSLELNKFSKSKLRFLRNAFYARQGYQFKSKDLQDFFGQFDWYQNMVKRNEYLEITNEDIVITKEDKARADLIREIENNK